MEDQRRWILCFTAIHYIEKTIISRDWPIWGIDSCYVTFIDHYSLNAIRHTFVSSRQQIIYCMMYCFKAYSGDERRIASRLNILYITKAPVWSEAEPRCVSRTFTVRPMPGSPALAAMVPRIDREFVPVQKHSMSIGQPRAKFFHFALAPNRLCWLTSHYLGGH